MTEKDNAGGVTVRVRRVRQPAVIVTTGTGKGSRGGAAEPDRRTAGGVQSRDPSP